MPKANASSQYFCLLPSPAICGVCVCVCVCVFRHFLKFQPSSGCDKVMRWINCSNSCSAQILFALLILWLTNWWFIYCILKFISLSFLPLAYSTLASWTSKQLTFTLSSLSYLMMEPQMLTILSIII